ncbi:MAG: ATP-binding cassette domain-containing protein, partial [Polyangiaceae bacterium]
RLIGKHDRIRTAPERRRQNDAAEPAHGIASPLERKDRRARDPDGRARTTLSRAWLLRELRRLPPGVTGREFIEGSLAASTVSPKRETERLAGDAIEHVGLGDAAERRIQAYSKGMRRRMRLALSLSHQPRVLVLDEPLNGLNPMARADAMALFRGLGREGMHVIVSSHILHEVERVSNRVILLAQGYVVADGPIQEIRGEVTEHPHEMRVRCHNPHRLAAKLSKSASAVEIEYTRTEEDYSPARVTGKPCRFVQRGVAEDGLKLESITPVDDDAFALYRYLVEPEN